MKGEIVGDVAPVGFCSQGLMKVLLREGLASESEIERAKHAYPGQKVLLGLSLLKGGGEQERGLLLAVSKTVGLPYVETKRLISIPRDVQQLAVGIEKSVMILHRMVPYGQGDGILMMACADPLDSESLSTFEFVTGRKILPALASEDDIMSAIERMFLDEAQMYEAGGSEKEEPEGDVERGSKSAPVVRLVSEILREAVKLGASDVHFEPSERDFLVRFRIDGVMSIFTENPKSLQQFVLARIKILSAMDITEKRRPQDGRFRVRISTTEYRDLRVSAVPTPAGENIVIRILRGENEGVIIDGLGIPDALRERFERILTSTDKVLLVTGPTGSGKTTLLYAALRHLSRGDTTIISVEDPVEFRVEGVTQIAVNKKVGMTFASALRSILRQDPDVIMVGEIRDGETAEVALQAAQTGHLVLSTLHTNTAPGAMVRLTDLGVDASALAASVGAIVAQRLVRKVCTHCSRAIVGQRADQLREHFSLDDCVLNEAVGCEECGGTGYRGRTGIYSLLEVDDDLRELIRQKASEEQLARCGERHGYESLAAAAVARMAEGLTTVEEIERVMGKAEIERHCAEKKRGGSLTVPPIIPSEGAAGRLDLRERADRKDRRGESGAPSIAQLAGGGDSTGERRILLVDDDPRLLAVMEKILTKNGYVVTVVNSAQDGAKEVSKGRFNLIVCDLMMPGVSGLEFVQALRAAEKGQPIPVLILTGSDSEENEVILLDSGASDFVSKSASPKVFLSRVRRLLNMR